MDTMSVYAVQEPRILTGLTGRDLEKDHRGAEGGS